MDGVRHRRRVRRVASAVAGTWTARAYLALCGSLLVWVLADAFLVSHEDASMAGVVPLLATAPLSMLFLLAPGEGILTYLSVVVVSALANAALINWCVRALGRGGRSTGDAG
ncbi:SCO4225 family membrane protein [Streptomyces radiopugnans]|uniref:SCO4225 family membrane protein n=1 Tax=Streptomyces radiopugnans TaxID=403935 RepID=UPI003F1C0E9A